MRIADIVEGVISARNKPCMILSLSLLSIGYAVCLLTLVSIFAIIKGKDKVKKEFFKFLYSE